MCEDNEWDKQKKKYIYIYIYIAPRSSGQVQKRCTGTLGIYCETGPAELAEVPDTGMNVSQHLQKFSVGHFPGKYLGWVWFSRYPAQPNLGNLDSRPHKMPGLPTSGPCLAAQTRETTVETGQTQVTPETTQVTHLFFWVAHQPTCPNFLYFFKKLSLSLVLWCPCS